MQTESPERYISSFNNVTRQPEVRFRIEMWNDAVEREVTKYTSGLVGHSVKSEQIRVLPLEKVLLSSQSPSPTYYQTSKVWSEYQRHRYLWFSLTCSQLIECDDLAAQMRSNPEQFGHLKLLFSLSSQTSERKETIIRIDNIVTGEMMTKLDQRYPDAKEVYKTNVYIVLKIIAQYCFMLNELGSTYSRRSETASD